jgi:hypothetical protein
MDRNVYLSFFFAALIFCLASCGGTTPGTNGVTNGSNAAANHPPMTTSSPAAETFNNAPTLTPVVQAYYDALRRKDDAAVRETLTKDFVKRIEADMKEKHRTDLAGFLAEDDYRPGQVMEVRNEKTEGDKAQAEIRGGPYKNWIAFTFAKEDGKWKFTGGSPVIDNMPRSNANSPH